MSPDVHPLLRRKVELVPGLHVERLVPGVEIADDSIHPILLRTVRVAQQLVAQGALARFPLPGLRISDQEALVAGEAVDDGRLAVPRDIAAIRGVSGLEAAKVREIL